MGRGSRVDKEPDKLTKAVGLRQGAAGIEGEGAGGSANSNQAHCEQKRELSIVLTQASSLVVGTSIRLRLGAPPVVLAGGKELGRVANADASTAEACLLEGFALTGSVLSIDPLSGTGRISIAGHKIK